VLTLCSKRLSSENLVGLHAPSFSVVAEEWVGKAALLLQGEDSIFIFISVGLHFPSLLPTTFAHFHTSGSSLIVFPRTKPFWLSKNPTGGFLETHLAISHDERDLTVWVTIRTTPPFSSVIKGTTTSRTTVPLVCYTNQQTVDTWDHRLISQPLLSESVWVCSRSLCHGLSHPTWKFDYQDGQGIIVKSELWGVLRVSSGHGGCQRTFEFLTREQGGKSDYNLQSDEINSVSVCITLLEYLPRTDTRVTLRLPTTVVSCQGEREKDTFTRVIGYLYILRIQTVIYSDLVVLEWELEYKIIWLHRSKLNKKGFCDGRWWNVTTL
jgi:hypothetical protein